MQTPCARPIGGVQQQIGVLRIATPHRETQVVANQRPNPPALEFELHLTLAGRVVIVLTRHTEQVALVVMPDFAVRACPQQAIAMAAIRRLNDHAAGDHCIELRGLRLHPFAGRAMLGFGEGLRRHGETGGEHLRQDDQVGASGLLQQHVEVLKVGLTVMPGEAGLDQRQIEIGQRTQITHSFAAASRSVSSRLAKHRRTKRWPCGGS